LQLKLNEKKRSFPVSTFLKYIMAFAVQTLMQRTGRQGAVPPMRIPFGKNKGQSVPLPVIGPWQMMIAMWVARQIWTVYGDNVKSKLKRAKHPLVQHVGTILPDTGKTPAPSMAKPPASASAPSPASTPSATPPAPVQYGTRPLDDSANGNNNSGNLPPGSLLNSLRSLN
jgi:hypothetical protein